MASSFLVVARGSCEDFTMSKSVLVESALRLFLCISIKTVDVFAEANADDRHHLLVCTVRIAP